MKIVKNKIIPFNGFLAINMFGILFTKSDHIPPTVINHEKIHTAQMREMFYIPFYILYLLEWIWYLISVRDSKTAYYMISFEKEAYENERNINYLVGRKKFAWLGYLRRKNKS